VLESQKIEVIARVHGTLRSDQVLAEGLRAPKYHVK
jgi:hypothetical protein